MGVVERCGEVWGGRSGAGRWRASLARRPRQVHGVDGCGGGAGSAAAVAPAPAPALPPRRRLALRPALVGALVLQPLLVLVPPLLPLHVVAQRQTCAPTFRILLTHLTWTQILLYVISIISKLRYLIGLTCLVGSVMTIRQVNLT